MVLITSTVTVSVVVTYWSPFSEAKTRLSAAV